MAAQVTPLPVGDARETATTTAAPPAKRVRRTTIVLPALLAAAALAGAAYYARGIGKESTDDAQIEGHVMTVAARVPGQVARVYVEDNQIVKEGDLLVELDHGELDAKVDAAKADLAATRAQLANAEAQLELTSKSAEASLVQAKGGLAQASGALASQAAAIKQAEAEVAASQARLDLATEELARERKLLEGGAISQAAVDARQAEFDQARAAGEQARARLESARASTSGASGGIVLAQGKLAAAQTVPQQVAAAASAVELARARVKQAESQLSLAELAASYAYVRAPHGGEVSRRTVEVGQMVGPDKPLLAVVPLDDVWVIANFKEDQLADMKPGEPATVTVDAFGSRPLQGHVDSIAGASGARFALLPPDNASGNFVKVVQRVPVLVRLDAEDAAVLRPGMSANVTVRTK